MIAYFEKDSAVSPTVAGISVYGFPKRESDWIKWYINGTETRKVFRWGKQIVAAKFTSGGMVSINGQESEGNSYFLKYIPSIEENGQPDVLKLTQATSSVEVTAVDAAPILEIEGGEIVLDTGRILPVTKVVNVSHSIINLKYEFGKILENYEVNNN